VKCLVIDENPTDRQRIAGILQAAFDTVECLEISTPQELGEILTRPNIDLIISEYQLSWTNGLTLLKNLQSCFPSKPILICTDSGNEDIAVAVMKAGASDYLRKVSLETRLIPAVRESLLPGELFSSGIPPIPVTVAAATQTCRLDTSDDERFQVMADALPAYISYVDTEERYRFNNAAHEKWYGLTREQLYGRTLKEMIGPQSYARDQKHIQAALSGQQVRFEVAITAPDGSAHTHQIEFIPHTLDHVVQGFYILITDITNRKLAEEERLNQELKYRSIVEQSTDGILLIDENCRLIEWNAAMEKITRFPAGQVLGLPIWEIQALHPLSLETGANTYHHTPESIHRYLDTINPRIHDITIPDKEGRLHIVQMVIFPIHTAHGKRMAGAIARDVTEIRKSEQERENLLTQVQTYAEKLRQTNNLLHLQNEKLVRLSHEIEAEHSRLEAVLQQMPSGIIIVEAPSGRLLLLNSQMQILQQETKSLRWNPAHAPDWAYQREGAPYTDRDWPLARTLHSGETISHETIEIHLPDGSCRLADINSAPIRDHEGKIVAGVMVIHDITAYHQSELEREHLIVENHQQRAFLERLVAAAPVGIAVIRGPDRRYELVNPCYQRLPGVLRPPENGRTIAEIFPPEAIGPVRQLLSYVCQTAHPIVIREHQVWDEALQKFTYWNLEYVPLPIALFNPEERILILAHDVTEEVRARREIEALALRNETIMNSITEGLVILDLQGRISSMNPTARQLHRLQNVETMPHTLAELEQQIEFRDLNQVILPPDETPMARALHGETFSNYEIWTIHRATGNRWIGSYSGNPVKNKAGTTLLSLCTIRDVTAQKEAEQRREQLLHHVKQQRRELKKLTLILDRERRKLQTIMENTPAMLAYLDTRFRLVSYNSTYLRNSGHSEQDILGASHFELFPHPENQARFTAALQTGQPLTQHAQPFSLPHYQPGTTYWDWTLIPIINDNEQVQGLVYSMLDVTEREKTRREREARLIAMKALLNFSRECLTENTIDSLLKLIVDTAREMLNVRLSLAHYRSRGLFYQGSCVPPAQISFIQNFSGSHENGLLETFQNQETLWLKNEDLQTYLDHHLIPPSQPPLQELLGARLMRRNGQPGGIILLAEKTGGEFTAEDERLLAQLAALTSLALQHIEARTDAEQRADELATIFAAMADGVMVYNAQGNVLRANLAAEPFCRTENGLTPLNLHLMDGSPLPKNLRPAIRALQGELVVDEPYLLRSHTFPNPPRIIRASASPLYSNERLWGAVLVWHDVTHQEQLLAQLESERARLKAIIEAAPEGIIVINRENTIALANPAANQLYSRSFHPGDPLPGRLAVASAALEGVLLWNLEIDLPQHASQSRHLLANAAPIPDPRGGNQGAVVIFRDLTEHKRLLAQVENQRRQAEAAAQEIRLTNNLLQTLINTLPAGVLVSDPQGMVLLSNPAAQTLTGGLIPLRLNTPLDSQIPAPTFTLSDLPLQNVLQQGETIKDIQLKLRLPNGTEQVLLAAAAPVRDETDQIISAVQVFQDITELKQTRESLRQYAERLELLHGLDRAILAAPSAEEIALVTLQTIQNHQPYHTAVVAGFNPEQKQFQPLANSPAIPGIPAQIPLEWVWYLDSIHQGHTYRTDDIQNLPQESPLVQQIQALDIRTFISIPLIAQGTPIGILSLTFTAAQSPTAEQQHFIQEVADELAIGLQQASLREEIRGYATKLEQRVADRTAELQASEARFRTIFESAALGIALIDLDGRLLESNPALEKMFEANALTLRQYPLAHWIQLDEATFTNELYQALINGRQQFYKTERRYQRLSGQPAWANLTLSLIQDPAGLPRYMIGMIEDITRQQQAQAALIQAEKLATAGKLATTLAHEINNPLQSVIGCLSLAEETLAEGGSVERYLRVANEDLQRAARIVAQLRDLNRQILPQECKPSDVNQLLERMLILSRKQCQDQHVEIQWRPAKHLPQLNLVPDRISQVFLNLIINAVDAMPEGGKLEIRTANVPTPPAVKITFTDTGIGIPDFIQNNLFDPFYTTKTGGLGIGLFIAHNIIHDHGGRIEAKSREARGTTFTIWLPVKPDGNIPHE